MKKKTLKFTGERLIPKINKNHAFYYEHLNRYYFASQFSKSKIVLDVACGTGYGSQIISKQGRATRIIGIDISKKSIKYAKKNYQEKNINFLIDDAQTLNSQKDNSFDLIISFETIEHIKSSEDFIKQTKRLLKKDGVLIISTPNTNTYPKGNKYHINELSPDEFRSLLKKYYKFTKDYYQKFYLSNLISQGNEANFNNINEDPELNDSTSEYLICICSNQKIKNYPGIINNLNKIDQIDVTKGYISLSNQFSNLDKENKRLEESLNKIKLSKIYKIFKKYKDLKKYLINK